MGHDITKSGASAIIYSMDKATGSSTSGLVIGREDVMVNIRRAWACTEIGTAPPPLTEKPSTSPWIGQGSAAPQIAVLKDLRDNPNTPVKSTNMRDHNV